MFQWLATNPQACVYYVYQYATIQNDMKSGEGLLMTKGRIGADGRGIRQVRVDVIRT